MAPTSQVALVQSKVRADNRRHLVESERTPAARLDHKRFSGTGRYQPLDPSGKPLRTKTPLVHRVGKGGVVALAQPFLHETTGCGVRKTGCCLAPAA